MMMRWKLLWTWLCDALSAKKPGYEAVATGDERLPRRVFAAEQRSIAKRRREFGFPEPAGSEPSTDQDLVGVAVSGGGIRSATFNLGVLQALGRYGLFSRVDYLSTVSGGGYLGSAISSLCATAPDPDSLRIILSGVPAGARLSAGVQTVDGCWRLDRQDLDDLRLYVPAGMTVAMTLTARVESIRDNTVRTDRLRVILRPGDDVPPTLTCAVHRHDGGQGLRLSQPTPAGEEGLVLPLHIHTEAFPFAHLPGVTESESFRHLRDSSNYLVPREPLAGFRLPALFLRGLLINLLVILPLVVIAALTTLWVSSGSLREAMDTEDVTLTLNGRTNAPWVRFTGAGQYEIDLPSGISAMMVGDSSPRPDRAAVVSIPRGVRVDGKTAMDTASLVFAVAERPRIAVTVTSGATRPATLNLRLWRESGDTVTPATMDPITALHERALVWVRGGVAAFLALLALYPVLEWAARRGGRQSSWRTRDIVTRYGAGGALMAILLTTAILIQPLAIYYYHRLSHMQILSFGDAGEVMTTLWTVLTGLGVLFSGSLAERTAGLRGRIMLQVLGLMGPIVIWLVYLNICRWALVPETTPDWLMAAGMLLDEARRSADQDALGVIAAAIDGFGHWLGVVFEWADDGSEWLPHSERMTVVYGAVAVLITLVTQFFYDVNASSFHGFYRDRLSRAYLFDIWHPRAGGRARQNDRQTLSGLDERRAPYHLINTTLNVQQSHKANMRGRNGSNVIMSKAYVGGQLTGYRATRDMEALHPPLTLGTAMAISGAAAAPNMGRNTVRGLTFALTLLNIRLGYWLPNPDAYTSPWFRKPVIGPISRLLVRPFLRVTPFHLLKEMLGALNESGLHVNLTDGGHLENMGLIELLRRRCRVIIVCDAEADPGMTFQGFADAVRMARIDLGVTIEIDVDPLRPEGPDHVSRAHAAVGRINYGDGEFGYILYLKSSVTGDENVYVEKYRAQEPTFPHQTTADQFFDEEQFEAYRALGFHAAESVLGKHLVIDPFARDLDGLVESLRKLKGVALV